MFWRMLEGSDVIVGTKSSGKLKRGTECGRKNILIDEFLFCVSCVSLLQHA
jgi:hypothetical protein